MYRLIGLLSMLLSPLAAASVQLWGLAPAGGEHEMGVLFKYQPLQERFEVLHDFSGPDGAGPQGALLHARDGKLYGVSAKGGSQDRGILFSFTPATRTYAVEREFLGTNGAHPESRLIEAPNGLIYGSTTRGGRGDRGLLFRFNPNDKRMVVLHRFDGSDGQYPKGHLAWYNGRLYGTARDGGTHLRGTLFSIRPDGSEFAVHHHFDINTGTRPIGGLIDVGNGSLYGTTSTGALGGSIFAFDPATGTLTTQSRSGAGGLLYGSIVQASQGLLYGLSVGSGLHGRGFIYSFDPRKGGLEKRFSFVPWYQLGWGPSGELVAASNGRLYGLAASGGRNDGGVLFEFSTASDTYLPRVHLGGDKGRLPEFTSLIEVPIDVPATEVRRDQCGHALPMRNVLMLGAVNGASEYVTEVYGDPELRDLLTTVTTRLPRIPLTSIPGVDWSGTYYLQAKANAAGRYSSFGRVCELRIADEPLVVPQTQINAMVASGTISPYTILRADPVTGATGYELEVRDLSGELLWNGPIRRVFTLDDLGLRDWDRTYRLKVRARVGDLFGQWGQDVQIHAMPEPQSPPIGAIRPADCGRVRSLYQPVVAEPVAGASRYEFEIYREGALITRIERPVPWISLEERDGIRWSGRYQIRVKPGIGPIDGEFGAFCELAFAPPPAYGLQVFQLRPRDCGAWLSLADFILTAKGQSVNQYEWEFFGDDGAIEQIATAYTKIPRLSLGAVAGLENGVSYWVRVRGHVGPYHGPEGALCVIHIEAASP